MSEVKRYDCTNGGFAFCQGCYQMEEDPLGDYVSSEDYDALVAKLAMAEDAAAKGDAARQQCGGMEMEIEELRAELAELRARVVVLPSVDNVMNIVMRYQWNEKTNVTGTTNWAANLGMKVVEEVKRLNGKTVSEGLLRRVCAEPPATCCMDDEMTWRRDLDSALLELRALLSEQEGGKQ